MAVPQSLRVSGNFRCPYCAKSFFWEKGQPAHCLECSEIRDAEVGEMSRMVEQYQLKDLQKKIEKLLMEKRDAEVIELMKGVPPASRPPFRALWSKYHQSPIRVLSPGIQVIRETIASDKEEEGGEGP